MTRIDTIAKIERHAKRQGLTVRQLFFRAGGDYSTYWRWVHKNVTPQPRTVDKLLAVEAK